MINTIESVGKHCCGCRGCEDVCPADAIAFLESEEGFFYPVVSDACIACGKCLKTCPVAHPPAFSEPICGYAAYLSDREQLRKSSSGGMFVAVAHQILSMGGTVYGCAEPAPGEPCHIAVSDSTELSALQGSKYTQSDMTDVYRRVKETLSLGTPVLFTGTPCQVAGLLNAVGKPENLYTADIICHGVPSRKMYQAYLSWLENKTGSTIKEFLFRSKEKHDWSLTYRVRLQKGNKEKVEERMATFSPYYRHFLRGMDYRESCYACPFAQRKRVSDLTLGDFWGIENVLPDFYNPDGVSAVLVNTPKGKSLWKSIEDTVCYESVPVDKIVENNGQLKAPTKRHPQRDRIYIILNTHGYDAVVKAYADHREALIDSVKDRIPNRVRQKIKKLLKEKK